MKVFGISMGRRMGNSEVLLKQALKACEDAGLEVSFARLHDFEIKPCTGCELCTKLMRTNQPVRCFYQREADDYLDLIDELRTADGLIFAAPAYQLLPPGYAGVMLNRNHGAGFSASLRRATDDRRMVCATISVGGSDWTSLTPPIMNFIATEMLSSRMNLVDQMKVHRTPAQGMALYNPVALERARLLGQHVAEELLSTEPIKYRGEEEGVCPICHNDVVLIRNGRITCAFCDYEGDPVIEDGKITSVKWDGGIEVTRWSKHGKTHHDKEQFTTVKFGPDGYVFSDEQKKIMAEGREKWGNYLKPVLPKRLRKEET